MHPTKDWTEGLPSLGAQRRVNWRQKQALQVPSDPDYYPGASPEGAAGEVGLGLVGTPSGPRQPAPPRPKQEGRGPGTLRIWKYCALGDGECPPLSCAPRPQGLGPAQWHLSWAKIRGGQLCVWS